MKKLKAEEREKKKREKEKLEVEMKAEEEKKKRREKEDIEKRIAEDKLEALKKTPIGAKVFSDMTADVSGRRTMKIMGEGGVVVKFIHMANDAFVSFG